MSRVRCALMAGITCAAFAGAASAAEIYKWVDENGTTHYSDSRPNGVKSQVVTEGKLSIIPGSRIGAEAARAAELERARTARQTLEYVPIPDTARAQRRDELMQRCMRNNGVECDREVDTELRAEGLQEGRGVIRTVPPPVAVPANSSGSATSSAPSAPASALR